jgi:tetratricopeptide (TPR) repeat protein
MSERRNHLSHDLDALRFLDALDAGDLEAVAALWEKAAADPALEQVLTWTDEEAFVQTALAAVGKLIREAVELHSRGKGEESLLPARQATEAFRLLHPLPARPEVAVWLNQLGALQLALGEPQLAEELLLSALAVGRSVWEANHPCLARCLHNLAVLEDRKGLHSEAERDYRRALQVLGQEGLEAAAILGNLGSLCSLQGRLDEAAALLRRSLELREKALGPHHPELAPAWRKLAAVFDRQGRPAAAAALRRRAAVVLRKGRAVEPLGARPGHASPPRPGSAVPADAALHDGRP